MKVRIRMIKHHVEVYDLEIQPKPGEDISGLAMTKLYNQIKEVDLQPNKVEVSDWLFENVVELKG